MATVSIKRNDTHRLLSDTLMIGKVVIDLTNSTVTAVFSKEDTVIRHAASILEATAGTVSCDVPDSVAGEVGSWSQEWEIVFENQRQLTVPTEGYNEIIVNPDLG